MPIYKIIKRVVTHEHVLIECEDEEALECFDGDELTLETTYPPEDIEMVVSQPAAKEEELEYRKHYPKK